MQVHPILLVSRAKPWVKLILLQHVLCNALSSLAAIKFCRPFVVFLDLMAMFTWSLLSLPLSSITRRGQMLDLICRNAGRPCNWANSQIFDFVQSVTLDNLPHTHLESLKNHNDCFCPPSAGLLRWLHYNRPGSSSKPAIFTALYSRHLPIACLPHIQQYSHNIS